MALKRKRNETGSWEVPASPVQAHAVQTSANNAPNHDDIRCRAYEIYLERGGAPGHEVEDWLQAEREIGGAVSIPTRKDVIQEA
jgi:hypothetical protein